MSKKQILQSTVDIVKAYVAANKVPVEKLPQLVSIVLDAVSELEKSTREAPGKTSTLAVAIRKSVNRNRIVCLEDGKTFKALKRHLRTAHDLTPEEYRSKWGLQDSYPMVAPSYSAKRSELAKKMGLGQKSGSTGKSVRKVTEAA